MRTVNEDTMTDMAPFHGRESEQSAGVGGESRTSCGLRVPQRWHPPAEIYPSDR